jgi:hypothetical protein
MGKKLSIKKVITIAIMVCFILTPGFLGQAFSKTLISFADVTKVSTETHMLLSAKVIESTSYNELDIQYALDVERTVVSQFPEEDYSIYAVRVPIIDNTGFNYSSYTTFFDSNYQYLESVIFYFEKTVNETYEFTAITDHSKMLAEITEDGTIIKGDIVDSEGVSQDLVSIFAGNNAVAKTSFVSKALSVKTVLAAGFWSCFNSCLASMGIAAWAIAALGFACGTVCVGTAGTGCLLCLKAAQVITTGTVTYCFGMCW